MELRSYSHKRPALRGLHSQHAITDVVLPPMSMSMSDVHVCVCMCPFVRLNGVSAAGRYSRGLTVTCRAAAARRALPAPAHTIQANRVSCAKWRTTVVLLWGRKSRSRRRHGARQQLRRRRRTTLALALVLEPHLHLPLRGAQLRRELSAGVEAGERVLLVRLLEH